jgi:DNA-binding NarL/FixJ family response regulator
METTTYVVAEAVDGFDTLEKVRNTQFDVLLMDLSMPGRSGVDLIRQIKDEFPKLPILILTMHEEEQYAVRAIRAGARGYLTKKVRAHNWLQHCAKSRRVALYQHRSGRAVSHECDACRR